MIPRTSQPTPGSPCCAGSKEGARCVTSRLPSLAARCSRLGGAGGLPTVSLDSDELEPEEELAAEGPGPESLLMLMADHEAVASALEEVGETYRHAVRLWLEGRDNFQIAAAIGTSYNTARSRLSRGRAQILAALRAELRA